MTIIRFIVTNSFEELQQVIFDQLGAAEYGQYLSHGASKMEVVLDDCNEAVRNDGHMNLYPDSILGINPERLDLEMLFDSSEEKYHLPAVAVKLGNVLCLEMDSSMHHRSDFDSDHNIRIPKVGYNFCCSKFYA